MEGWACGCLDLQESGHIQSEQNRCMSRLPSTLGLIEDERRESIVIEDDVTNYTEDGSPWQRVKWTGKAVKLLITTLSYIGEDPSTDCAGSRIKVSSLLRKQGKWKCVSKVMADQGYHVSPQQCEDKFNNLNKTYRRLNDLLGRGTSCKVVDNPELLDTINVSERGKEEARKLLTSKHLFFEEMCSYHNGNRLYLPHDPDLLRSLLFILKNNDDYKLLDTNENKVAGCENPLKPSNVDRNSDARPLHNVTHQVLTCHNEIETDEAQNQCMVHRMYELEKQKLQLKSKVLNLEKRRLKWKRRSLKQDLELDKMRLGNECLKLGNERMAMQLKRKRTDLERV